MHPTAKNEYFVDVIIDNSSMVKASKLFTTDLLQIYINTTNKTDFSAALKILCQWLKSSQLRKSPVANITSEHTLDLTSSTKEDLDLLCILANEHFLATGTIVNLLGTITPVTDRLVLKQLHED